MIEQILDMNRTSRVIPEGGAISAVDREYQEIALLLDIPGLRFASPGMTKEVYRYV